MNNKIDLVPSSATAPIGVTPLADWYHQRIPKLGILFLNLGTPDAPTKQALYPYLKQFLSDPRVIELPRLKWWFILHAFILPFRPKQSAALYKKIWTEQGSPLMVITEKQGDLLKRNLRVQLGEMIELEVGMRYGNPSIAVALEKLRSSGVSKLLVLPLYPQYSATTTASTFDAVVDELKRFRLIPEFRMITSFHDDPGYISSIANSIREFWNKNGEPEKLLFSFHGIPLRYFLNGDPYPCHCRKTARLVAEELRLPQNRYIVAFQSLFGKEEWIKPPTDLTIKALPKEGVLSLDVVCPGFVSDCLETIEEIDQLNRGFFLEAGGKTFRYIPCLNDRPDFIQALTELTLRHLQGWITEKRDVAVSSVR